MRVPPEFLPDSGWAQRWLAKKKAGRAMGKLVLYLPDGSMHDVPLDKERLTIGRRADNDVCLPYPAVSGEHAAVVTILADSFLEDLGSTNGTLVNGKPVVKHFLRDNDQIDIGRQRLIYFVHDGAQAEPAPARHAAPGSAGPARAGRARARGARGAAQADRSTRRLRARHGRPAVPGRRAARGNGIRRSARPNPRNRPCPFAKRRRRSISPPTAVPALDVHGGAAASPRPGRPIRCPATRLPARRPRDPRSLPDEEPAAPAEASAPASEGECAGPLYRVRVLSGPNAGRELALARAELSVGRVGTQVARLQADDGRWRLAPLEAAEPLELNGSPVPAGGALLAPGDRFRVAGTDLVFERC